MCMVLTYDDGLAHLKGVHLKKLRLDGCYITDADLRNVKDARRCRRFGN